jgi:citrate lyase subunit beta/citryl-CoA lyase
VPGDRTERFDKAASSGSDEVICDLEDAVSPNRKPYARDEVFHWLANGGEAWVRINGFGTKWHPDDLDVLTGAAGLRGFVVPKAEAPDDLTRLAREVQPYEIVALVETARGIYHAYELAQCPGVSRLAFGSIDFAEDIGAKESVRSMSLARATLVLASRVGGIASPIDSVTSAIHDVEVIETEAQRAREIGFGGKLCIHPAQIRPIANAFRPTTSDVQWAERVMAAAGQLAGGGVAVVDGRMIDKPLVARAVAILAHSQRLRA